MNARIALALLLLLSAGIAFTPFARAYRSQIATGSAWPAGGHEARSGGETIFLGPVGETGSRPFVDSRLIRFGADKGAGTEIRYVRVLLPAGYRVEAPGCRTLSPVTMQMGSALHRQWGVQAYMTADAELLAQLATKLCRESRARTPDEELRVLVNFVQGLRYRKTIPLGYELHSPCQVLLAGEGHCWEKTCLAATLVRARGIPCAIVYIRPVDGSAGHAQLGYLSAEPGTVKLKLGSDYVRTVELCSGVAGPTDPLDAVGALVLSRYVRKGVYLFCESVEPAHVWEGQP